MSAEVVERFYAAFDRRDGEAMAAAYAPDGHFKDPVFGDLTGAEAGAATAAAAFGTSPTRERPHPMSARQSVQLQRAC